MDAQKLATFKHLSVLSRELIAGLDILPAGKYLDATEKGG